MSSAPHSTKAPETPEPSSDSHASTDDMTEDELIAHALSGAAERVRDAVERLVRLGVTDKTGKVLATELPRDMRPDSTTTVVTG
jgi:hypothetical protein